MSDDAPVQVCLGYPAYLQPRYTERLAAIDARIVPIELPVNPGGDWAKAEAGVPHPEPPAWASSVAEERLRALAEAEVMFSLQAPQDMMKLMPKLRWLQGMGAGVEQFAAAGVSRDRVVVTNASGVSAPSMAEWVIGRLLQIWKRFPEAEAHQRRHEYVRTYGRTFAGSVLGIVGLGSIGCAVSQRARALGVRVLGLKRSHRPGDTSEHADALYGTDQLHEMLAQCDAVVIAAPATADTHHLIDAAALAALPAGAVVVNVARGSLLDEAALIDALERDHIGAAALDVFEQEPLPADSPLWDVPRLHISAHSSVTVDRYLDDIFDLFIENLTCYVKGRPLRNQVDMEALGFPATAS